MFYKEEYVIHERNLKHALNHSLLLKKVHRVTIFNQKAWLKPYVNMNRELETEAENNLKKLFIMRNNVLFGETMENLKKFRCWK